VLHTRIPMTPRRILLVEDDADTRLLYATALNHAGYDVLNAGTGTSGLSQARMTKPDLILMDMLLPIMDGWEVRMQLVSRQAVYAVGADRRRT
jgi:CheY-like chemotaxis protein